MNLQENEYVKVWEKVLGTVLNWPPARINAFIQAWRKDLEDEDLFFYHEDPAYYLSFELLPRKTMEAIMSLKKEDWPTPKRWEIFGRVQSTVNDHLRWYDRVFAGAPEPDVNWQKLKQDIEAVLAEYNLALPSPEQVGWFSSGRWLA